MALEHVPTKCVNAAMATVGMMVGRGAQSIQGPDCGTIKAAKEFPFTTLGKSEPGTIAVAVARVCPTWQLIILCVQ
jgi:hypothetical protein